MKKIILPFFLIGSFVMVYVMAKTGASLKTPATPYGILNLEFAYNTAKAGDILKTWSPMQANPTDNIAVAKYNTMLDFIFLAFYAPFLFLLCRKLAAPFGLYIKGTGFVLGSAALAAGVFDIGENFGMLHTLSGQLSPNITLLTAISSLIKWFMVLVAVLFILIAGVAFLFKKIIGKRP